MSPQDAQNLAIFVNIGMQLATRTAEVMARIAEVHAGGAPITPAELDAATAAVAVSRERLVEAIDDLPDPAP